LLQTLPSLQTTPAHGLSMHLPALQLWPFAHCTFAHGFAAAQVSAHAWPAPQFALQAFSIMHFPLLLSQVCPEGQVTPAHGCRKQPAMQAPSMQVWLLAQTTPVHGSPVGTQVALQAAPPPHPITFAPTQGSGWQVPPRQTWPEAQVAAHPVDPEPPEPLPVEPAEPLPIPVVPALPVVKLPAAPVVPVEPAVDPCPALPLIVPVVPPLPAVVPPEVPACPPICPDGDAEPQPIAAASVRTTSHERCRSAAARILRACPDVTAIVPPDA